MISCSGSSGWTRWSAPPAGRSSTWATSSRRAALGLAAAALLLAAPRAAPGGEAAPAENTREVKAQMPTLGNLPFYTPKQACDELASVILANGKGELPMATKAGKIWLTYTPAGLVVDPLGDGSGKDTSTVALPRQGFSQVVAVPLVYADGSTGRAALCFGLGRKPNQLVVRNLTVVATQVRDTSIYVVDDNCNGKYNDAGQDALMVAGGKQAAPLGSVVVLGPALYTLKVAENGQTLTVTSAPGKVGAAWLSARNGYEMLAGAVVKGPDGNCFALRTEALAFLPVGHYSLEFASLADGIGRLGLIRGGGLALQVAEGEKPAVMTITPPKIAFTVTYDPKNDQVNVQPPKPETVTCNAGRFSYFFELPPAQVNIADSATPENKLAVGLRLPQNGRTGWPEALGFARSQYNLYPARTYRFEMVWPVGVGPAPQGVAQLVMPRTLKPFTK